MDEAALQAHWRNHAQKREEAWAGLRREQERREKLEQWRQYRKQASEEARRERQDSPAPDGATSQREPVKGGAPSSGETLDPERRRRLDEFLGRSLGEGEKQSEGDSHAPALDPERERRLREFLRESDRAQELRQDRGDGQSNDDSGEGQSL